MTIIHHARVDTRFGVFHLLAHGDQLVACEFDDEPQRYAMERTRLERVYGAFELRDHADPAGAATRLRRYDAGDTHALDDQPVELRGTPFQLSIWNTLRTIPAGTTWSYAALAARVGAPKAVRAAGAANGANPVALFVPCHRVIASDGTLGGYGGGLPRKQALLRHEGAELSLGV